MLLLAGLFPSIIVGSLGIMHLPNAYYITIVCPLTINKILEALR